ncbi:MAG: hypothetical protein CVU34_10960 [Betaproteobacteria bacterium HGW-Betaproteobacteria-7]|jgi:tetratricopeptide (TPR) repeat protein|nr:MAG: hypothetical protein CVU34_10960 [Betaproteobacteria bacterium HGW-Betaproteobacteria-7]
MATQEISLKTGGQEAAKERLPLLLLLGAMLGALALVFFGWEQSALSDGIQPVRHAEQKAREELDRRFGEGVIMLHAKQYEHALTAFHRVLELDPRMPEAHVNAGYALLGMGRFQAAADFFDTATNLRPNQLNAYYGLGEALMAMGDRQGALQAMETYLHRSPPDDPFRRKAEAAIWELRAAAATEGGK